MRRRILPVSLELIGIVAISSGIGIELASKAEIGYVIITVGSLFVATGAIIWGKFIKGGA